MRVISDEIGGTLMKILVVVAHPRTDSLTSNITERFTAGLLEPGHEYEIADLYAENSIRCYFRKMSLIGIIRTKYGTQVFGEMDRIRASDALVFIFPVWWYSMPAIMKVI